MTIRRHSNDFELEELLEIKPGDIPPISMDSHKSYPCDLSGECPYGESSSGMFCRNNCGLGVDEDTPERIVFYE